MNKAYLNIFDLSIYPNATVYLTASKKYGKLISLNYDLNVVTVKIDGGDIQNVHPSRIKPCLIDVESIHKHIMEEANRIGTEEGEQMSMFYLIKKNVDVFGWIEKKLAIKKKRLLNKNYVFDDINTY